MYFARKPSNREGGKERGGGEVRREDRGIGGKREALEKLQTGRFNVLTWPRGHWRPGVALHAAARVAQLYTMSQFESETEKKLSMYSLITRRQLHIFFY